MTRLTLAIGLVLLLLGLPARAQQREPVDVELVLGADISVSMTRDELTIQRDGYAAALTDPAVLNAIRAGAHGRIAIAYFEWAGVTAQSLVVPWTVIAGPADAAAVARRIAVPPIWQSRRTSISGAMRFAADLLAASPYKGIKRVIDLSGDGANNEGPPLRATRDAIVAQGITVNGLPVMTAGAAPRPYDVPNLDDYFGECVIGGPGAFVMPVHAWEQFPEAIRRKLLLELANRPERAPRAPVVLVQAKPAYDCLIGEKLWRQDGGRQHLYNPENDYRRREAP